MRCAGLSHRVELEELARICLVSNDVAIAAKMLASVFWSTRTQGIPESNDAARFEIGFDTCVLVEVTTNEMDY